MDITGYLASICIGIALGLIGGGGSILTVPVMVYLFSIDSVTATVYSLFIVGITSLVGSFSYFQKGLVNIKISIFFGIPSIISVFLTRAFIVPAIPQVIFTAGNHAITKSNLLLLFFAVLMIFASYSMIKKEKGSEFPNLQKNFPVLVILLQGLGVGIVTGLIGAGGGFLIIPSLVNILKIPMKTAIGTSLFIIAINSLAGFFFSINAQPVQWTFLLPIAFLAILGILMGSFLSNKIDGNRLKPVFGWFVMVMGVYIIIKETLLS